MTDGSVVHLARKISRNDAEGAKARTGRKQVGQGYSDSKVTTMKLAPEAKWDPTAQALNVSWIRSRERQRRG